MAEEMIRKDVDAIKADLAQLRKDIASLTSTMKEAASVKMEGATEGMQEKARNVWVDLEQKLEEVLKQGKEQMGNIEQQIGAHPSGSVLTAFGLGFIIAKLLDVGGRR